MSKIVKQAQETSNNNKTKLKTSVFKYNILNDKVKA